MRTRSKRLRFVVAVVAAMLLVSPGLADAQKMKHSAPKGHPKTSKASSKGSINGGAQKSPGRPAPASGSGGERQVTKESAAKKTGGRTDSGGNKTGGGNKVNVDNSKTNVNINVDNSKDVNIKRNTTVRNSPRVYGRPPYVYGGHRYYCHRPYYYHPYHAYYWGPAWHPWGFFVATLAVTAIVITVNSQQYHYDQGVYYVASDGGYVATSAPVGATIQTLPEGSQTVVVNETTNNYYYGGTYYEKSGDGYAVVPPTAGTLVPSLPEGGEEVRIGDVTYVKVGETYYQPVEVEGKDMYEVVQVEEGES